MTQLHTIQPLLYHKVQQNLQEAVGLTRYAKANLLHFAQAALLAQHGHLKRIALHAPGHANSQRRRLQRFLQSPIQATVVFPLWIRLVVSILAPPHPLVLILDETKLQKKYGLLMVALAHAQRAIPGAWTVYPADQAEAYPAAGLVQTVLALLRQVQAGLPAGTPVVVLADRGIGSSSALMQGVLALGWDFVFRQPKRVTWVDAHGRKGRGDSLVARPGTRRRVQGQLFPSLPVSRRVSVSLEGVWRAGCQEPWVLAVSAGVSPSGASLYALRMRIEGMFRDWKSHGWQLESVLLLDSHRVWMLCWVLALASLFSVSFGLALSFGAGGIPDLGRSWHWSVFRLGLFCWQCLGGYWDSS